MSTKQRPSNASSTGTLFNSDEHYAQCWWCRRSTCRLIMYIMFLIAYLCGGALCFQWIESPAENELRIDIRQKRQQFLQKHLCVTDRSLEDYIEAIVYASERGVSVLKNATVSDSNWSFGQSIFFSTTVVTTVGYGRTAPLSQAGKLFCVFFAIVGIPLTLIMFSAIKERLMVMSNYIFNLLQRGLPASASEFHIKGLYLIIVSFIHVTMFTLIPAAIFDFIEDDWTFLDSVYFCVISWTTVGLGDFVPGEHHNQRLRPLYKIFSSFYLFISIISMVYLIKTFHDTPNLNLGNKIYMGSDRLNEEEIALRPGDEGPKYTRQFNEHSVFSPDRKTSVSSTISERKSEVENSSQ